MKKPQFFLCAIAALFLFSQAASAATLLTESFELPEADPASAYTLNGDEFDDGGFDFYGVFSDFGPGGANAARDDFTGVDGSSAVAAQDLDSGDGPGGSPVVLTVGPAPIGGSIGLGVTASLGALSSEGAGFFNYESSEADGLTIVAVIDGSPTPIAAFIPTDADGDGDGGDLILDADLDGTPDGPILTAELADFTFLIPGAGASLDIDFVIGSTDSFEPIVIDNVRIVDGIPEPTTGMLFVLGLVAALAGQRTEK